MPSLSVLAEINSSAQQSVIGQNDNARAANGVAASDPNHASAGVCGAGQTRQASEDDRDDNDEDSGDESEAHEEEEARLASIEQLKQRLRAKQQQWMDARRDPILEWKEEEKWKRENDAYRIAAQETRRQEAAREQEKHAERERKVKRKTQQRVTKQKEREFRETLYQYELDVVKSEKRAQVISSFQRDDHRKNKQLAAEAEEKRRIEDEQRRKQSVIEALEYDRKVQHATLVDLTENICVADEIGRRFGMLPAIHTPPSRTLSDQDETSTVLVLRLNAPTDSDSPPVALSPSRGSDTIATKRLFFTVNLKRFKHVEEIKGETIGDQGGVELARALLTGACPRVKTVYLGWNHIKHSAIVALADCFVRGACGQLVKLDLRFNSIDANGMVYLLGALDHGGLPELREVVLQGNLLGDDGAKALAHAMLRGTLKLLRMIDIRQNRIRNAGILALWNVFTSECVTKFCPKLQRLDMRRNEAQGSLTRSFCPCPSHLEF